MPHERGFTARRRTLVVLLLSAAGVAAISPGHSDTGDTGTGTRPALRYIMNSNSAPSAAAAAGWNLLDVNSKAQADVLPGGTRGLIWVGDYDNSTCAWEKSEATLRGTLGGTADDPKVIGFYFSDEPDPRACPEAPAQHRARSRLIHELAPGKLTIMAADSNSRELSLAQMPLWRGAADRVALDPYPCYRAKSCDYSWISTIIRTANAARLPYWGVVQAFADKTWRWPTPAEARRMLSLWAASRASGLMTFAWRWDGNELRSRPALLDVLARFNKGLPQRRTSVTRRESARGTATEVHYTFTGPTSVTFNWLGSAAAIRFGAKAKLSRVVRARTPQPQPFSSQGLFREARLTGLKPGRAYRYSIGAGPVSTFRTAPTGPFRFDVEADVGDSGDYPPVKRTQQQIAADKPAFVLVPGDLTYGNDKGQDAVDRHFNDVMVWSRRAAYMPAWGNHEWDESSDDLRNYKGRFAIPHGHSSVDAPSAGCCGEDWGWFDAGPVRFISYPEPYSSATWQQWRSAADALMAAAQRNQRIRFIVTFGHRPAYSTGHHHGESALAAILDGFGDRYSKYVLNLNGHSHNYERFTPIHRVVHVTAAGGGATLEQLSGSDRRTAFRALRLIHVRVDVTASRMKLEAICGPATSQSQFSCTEGQVVDSFTIGDGKRRSAG
jgi:Calcineurin-like phosphoesterase